MGRGWWGRRLSTNFSQHPAGISTELAAKEGRKRSSLPSLRMRSGPTVKPWRSRACQATVPQILHETLKAKGLGHLSHPFWRKIAWGRKSLHMLPSFLHTRVFIPVNQIKEKEITKGQLPNAWQWLRGKTEHRLGLCAYATWQVCVFSHFRSQLLLHGSADFVPCYIPNSWYMIQM